MGDGEGGDRAGKEGLSELGNGVATPVVAGEGAIDAYERSFNLARVRSPPMFSKDVTWRGEQDGIDAPKESGEGAIHPSKRSCGRARGHSPPCLQMARGGERNVPLGTQIAAMALPPLW